MAILTRRSAGAASGRLIATGLIAATAAAWWALYAQQPTVSSPPMDEMCMPPAGTWNWSATQFGLSFCMWAVMMLAMMLPVATPMTLLVHRLGRSGPMAARISVAAFLLGYFLVWIGYGLGATGLQWLFTGLRWLTPMMDAANPALSGMILILAGAYQFSAWKTACLSHCRTPLGFLLSHGRRGGLRLGLQHGRYCLGCCWAEMLVMFAVGLMNVLWMGGITLAIIAERYLPGDGNSIRKLTGIGLMGYGMAQWL